MPEYSLPQDTIERFAEIACSNLKSQHHIETLAYLVGFKDGDSWIGTHLVFPEQLGSGTKVDDKGNNSS